MHPSVLTLLMEPLPRALLASPPGAKKLFLDDFLPDQSIRPPKP